MHMSSMDHLILVLLSMVVAFLPRFIPLRIFSTREIPQWFYEWMKYVPVSLFTALVVKDIFINTKDYSFIGLGYLAKIFAAVIVIGVAYRSRSMGLSVVFGLIAVALLALVLPV